MSISGARFAGLVGMAGGLLFTFYFIGLNALLKLLDSPFGPETVSATKMLVSCLASLCMAGGLVGLLTLGAAGTGWRKMLAITGTVIALLGLTSYIVGSLYIYSFPEKAFRQFFTPGGSILLTLGLLLLAAAVLTAGRWRGWRAFMPLLTALYFPLQFPIQAVFFLGAGKGPSPVLLGVWGIFWLLLGYAVWSGAHHFTPTRLTPEKHT